jgi:hypothetical protein
VGTTSTVSTSSIINVVAWKDELVDAKGFVVNDPYVEMFWLPILGPTATWLLRRLAAGLEHSHDGYAVDMEDLARGIGVAYSTGRHNPFARALHRCVMFGVAQQLAILPERTFAVRTHIPVLPQRHLTRLPEALRIAHHDWLHSAAQ